MGDQYSIADCRKAIDLHRRCLTHAKRSKQAEPIIATLDCQCDLMDLGLKARLESGEK